MKSTPALDKLPEDVLIQIASLLDGANLISFSFVSAVERIWAVMTDCVRMTDVSAVLSTLSGFSHLLET
jgi:hypothetical protein